MTTSKKNKQDQQQVFHRFSLQVRVQHIVLFSSTIVLVLTGIPLWCMGRPEYIWWGRDSLLFFGTIESARIVHRVAAVALMSVSFYHLLFTVYSREGRREFIEVFPKPKDLADLVRNAMYLSWLRDEQPRFGRYTYYEKFDYWAVYWGCVIMFVSGAALWFDTLAGEYLPWFPYSLAALIHSDEAILCALALFVWHFYNVHFKPSTFPGTFVWWHGKISREEMEENHPMELEKIIRENR